MAYVTYSALRSIISGHTSGTSYTLDFNAEKLDRSKKTIANKSISLGGQSEVLRMRKDAFWNVNSGIVTEANRPQWEEFLDSVDAGESFTFDAYGTSAVHDNPISVSLDDGSGGVGGDYSVARVDTLKQYRFTFMVREL